MNERHRTLSCNFIVVFNHFPLKIVWKESIGDGIESYKQQFMSRVNHHLPYLLSHSDVEIINTERAQLHDFVVDLVSTLS